MAFYSMVEVIDRDVSCCARPSFDITYHMVSWNGKELFHEIYQHSNSGNGYQIE